MSSWNALFSLLVQAPVPPAPEPSLPFGLGLPALLAIAAALLVALVVVVLLLRRKPAPPAEKPTPELPAEQPELKVELAPSELEAKKREEAASAHAEAEALQAERRARAEEAKRAEDAAERARLEAEAKALKDKAEEAKKAEYRARKEAEAEEKERLKREALETARLKAEQEARARAEAEERQRQAALEEARRAQAEAGKTLAQGLAKTRTQGFMARLNQMFGGEKPIDESVLAELEEVLFTADIGVRTAQHLVDLARARAKGSDQLRAVIRQEVERIVDLPAPHVLRTNGEKPHVIMVVGVNGSGKTTTIGKLAAQVTASGRKVVLAAGDTFRAAATEQLDVWAERAGAELVKGKEDADPAAVVFDAIKRAQASNADVVIADTAGRLHTAAPLMEELKKVKRVIGKAMPGAPHEVLLVVDSTNGQNAIAQAKQFHDAVGVTAIALTKLDGTAKGGVIIGISDELKIPVAWVGIGEKVSDLRPFEPKEFVSALFEA